MSQKGKIKRILIVDDEQKMCTTLSKSLVSSGYSCECTTDPVDALAILGRGNFELAVSDINMPGMDGLKLLDEISKVDPGIDTIMMTGYTDAYGYSDIIRAGAADFIAKPFRFSELEAKIERISRERKLQRELQELNIALGVLLQRAEKDKVELEETILSNIKITVLPELANLRKTHLYVDQVVCVERLEKSISELASPYIRKLTQNFMHLTPTEIRIAGMLRSGMRTKEIADLLTLSPSTVLSHRESLRDKLGLRGKKLNLAAYLRTFE